MKIKIGTRKSKLALAQTQMAADALKAVFPELETELVPVSTAGDRVLDKPLYLIGGKGVFVSEIEQMLADGRIDIAVHSAKDLPSELADGLEISAVLKRGSYNDVLLTNKGTAIKKNFAVGTGSLRRRLNFGKICPDAVFKDIRGNVDTRLKKLANRELDGLILAAAGLERLGLADDSRFDYRYFDYTDFLPAPCQGIIAIESRKSDFVTPIVKKINDTDTMLCLETEREVLRLLGADCTMPIGAYSYSDGNKIFLSLSSDGKRTVSGSAEIADRFELAKRLVKSLE